MMNNLGRPRQDAPKPKILNISLALSQLSRLFLPFFKACRELSFVLAVF